MLPILGRSPASRVAHAGTTLDAQELFARANHAARGLPSGKRVALDGGDALTRLTHFLGADLAGCATLLVEPTWTASDRAAVLADARPDLVLDLNERPGTATHRGERAGRGARTASGDTHFYLPTTSGSSGRPKVLIRSRRSWSRSFAALGLGLEPRDRVLIPGPLSSSLFLFGALHALHAGADVELLDKWSVAGAAEASRWATVVHLVPAMLSALLSTLERSPVLRAECGLRTVVCGGARVDEALAERLTKVLPGCRLVEYYGSAEHSLIAVRRGGSLRPVVEVDVRDPVDGVGELWVRSELAFDGYLSNGTIVPAATEDGWSTVGDRAVQHADGSLEVLGRAGSAINTGARIIGAEEIESVLRGAEGVRDVLVSASPHPRFGELVTAVIEIDPLAPPSLREMRASARAALEPAKRPRRWLAVRELPRTASGKPARALVTERLRAGTLDAEAL
ncbi:class I adenylate-forming enzyme family protein [Saccharopolyspora phatthalungensis]|uniref:Long-chain acyl-CoA synthetase n=1 Tax=Saccharopolyspora phatthalungensis TaxID=664693 RepID=A0A840Q919_9PSEU|nr:AMP-binding protein [Saccharopolyspora phatthalungensis]MBB5153263.1 long-chain acyl-CoA synthetase [Saccharopolyspora phatthalungensis]